MAQRKFSISDFKHRVALCSMSDIVEENGVMALRRKDVYHAWAYMTTAHTGSMFNKDGQSVKQNRDTVTHNITIRMRTDLDLTVSAWLYEERLKSPPRWFKILSYVESDEDGQYLTLSCRLVERAAEGERPAPPVALDDVVMPLPQGVVL